MRKEKVVLFLLLILTILATTSCGSRKVLYNPSEVRDLSRKLNVPISNDDPNMPLYVESSFWLGTPYRYGGNSKSGTDCSGFVGQVFQKVYGKKLDRSSDGQAKNNVHKVGKGSLKTGDLVFFRTARKSKKIDHVGIFLKDGYFIHASTSKGVIVSSLDEEYYKRTWQKGGRVK
ncbi:C40 family peptidase [Dysgonomonas macrotermitis]|uniref:Lipoprotein Spr n=1 Tax=Dysgonomonas macrotermitis TaxID=1346286 RepID=A0A1M5F682_9BACT|nr:C40 family peptidase [Dysgonomonas macrotermitis]SHF87019.1 lipoprotein Spr [Dysgonomonas macrotermitis]